jgi:hypothetical protein
VYAMARDVADTSKMRLTSSTGNSWSLLFGETLGETRAAEAIDLDP